MKIYTRTGDDGTTGLIGGSRVRKSDPRLDCYGTIDELNASLGLAAVALDRSIRLLVEQVQNDLFVIGSHLASPDPQSAHNSGLPTLDEQLITRLEMQIDAAESELPPLKNFILPGGSEPAARLHVARTICRRAERLLVDFAMDRPVPAVVLTYLNRLSDWLFVHARLANHRAGVADVIWKKESAD
ncbi:MAG TPA: cob(I)yrinic acid a,c-diamide adenosyltransferase [Tepidisphaeraceae bacterium]|jgi:cob(I)alamin adenosyltransferase